MVDSDHVEIRYSSQLMM